MKRKAISLILLAIVISVSGCNDVAMIGKGEEDTENLAELYPWLNEESVLSDDKNVENDDNINICDDDEEKYAEIIVRNTLGDEPVKGTISVLDMIVETENINITDEEMFKRVPEWNIDNQGNITKKGVVFIKINADIKVEQDCVGNFASFVILGKKDGKIEEIPDCFFHDGELVNDNIRDSGNAKLYANKENRIVLGFFGTDKIFECDELYLIPKFADVEGEVVERVSLPVVTKE